VRIIFATNNGHHRPHHAWPEAAVSPASVTFFPGQFIDTKDGKLDTLQWLAAGTGFLPKSLTAQTSVT
jgi:hypothetical protein